MQLAIPLTRSGKPLSRQVSSGLRGAILSSTLRAGDQLPSTRDFAQQLGVSRTVIVHAYEQLLAEGFVSGRPGSGTYVSEHLSERITRTQRKSAGLRLSRFGRAASQAVRSVETPPKPVATIRYDFRYGRSDLETFPSETWRQLLLRQARKASVRQFDYGSALGSLDLRAAICAHLRRSRAVECEPSEIIIVNGSQQALDLVIRVLVEPGDSVVIEEPHYNGTLLRLGPDCVRPQ
jgi:GntR family transcriptional regulator / MocR family aminotransferase